MHDGKHLNVLDVFQLVTPALSSTEKVLKLALRDQFLLCLPSEFQNGYLIEHRRHFVPYVVLKLLYAFLTLVLEGSEVEVGVVSFVFFYLIAQV